MAQLANGWINENRINKAIVNQTTMQDEQTQPIKLNRKQRKRALQCKHGTGSTKPDHANKKQREE
jgi:hypothetical protein